MKKIGVKLLSAVLGTVMLVTGCSAPAFNQADQNLNNTINTTSSAPTVYVSKTVSVNVEKADIFGDTVQIASSFAEFSADASSLATGQRGRAITVNSLTPQMVTLFDQQDHPLAFSIIPNPQRASTVLISPRSTAEGLVFMNPALATLELKYADKVMSLIKADYEIDTLSNLIETRVQNDPNYMDKEDKVLTWAVDRIVNRVVDKLSKEYSEASETKPNRVSGVEINTLRQDSITANFEFKNYKKRSVDLYFVNDGNVPIYKESLTSAYDFIDLNNLKLGRRPFVKSVGYDIQRKLSEVEVIGMGLKDIKQFSKDWKNMDTQAKMKYGVPIVSSIMNDFAGNVISIIAGFNVTKVWDVAWTKLLNAIPIMEVIDYYRKKEFGKAFKAVLSSMVKTLLEKNGALLRKILLAAGVQLTEAMIKKLTIVVGVFHLIRHGIEVARALYAYATSYIISYFEVEYDAGNKIKFVKKVRVLEEE